MGNSNNKMLQNATNNKMLDTCNERVYNIFMKYYKTFKNVDK